MHNNILIAQLAAQPFAIEPGALSQLADVLIRRSAGIRLDPAEMRAAIGDAPVAAATRRSRHAPAGIAVIPVYGVLIHRANMVRNVSGAGGTSTELLGKAISETVADPAVGAIVLDIDSPGGAVAGTPELADQIRAARQHKPIVAQVNATACSAAYWLAASATEVVCTPSGMVGSVGVIAMHEFYDDPLRRVTYIATPAKKSEGNPSESLAEPARAHMQRLVDQAYRSMLASIARGRGLSVDFVESAFGQGRIVSAEAALRSRMIDRIGTLQQTVDRLQGRPGLSARDTISGRASSVVWAKARLKLLAGS